MDSILSVQSNDFTGDGYESFSSRHSSRKEFTLIIPWNLRKSCEDPSCRHRTDPRQMALERAARREKELQQYCYNQHWMKSGRLILWNAIAICEMSKTSWQIGKLTIFFFEQWLNITRFQHDINQNFINLARKFYQESFLGMAGGIW